MNWTYDFRNITCLILNGTLWSTQVYCEFWVLFLLLNLENLILIFAAVKVQILTWLLRLTHIFLVLSGYPFHVPTGRLSAVLYTRKTEQWPWLAEHQDHSIWCQCSRGRRTQNYGLHQEAKRFVLIFYIILNHLNPDIWNFVMYF